MLENQDEQKIIDEAESKMDNAIESLARTYATLRAGRANPHVLDRVLVDYYGIKTPINQVATITSPDATTIVISPFEPSVIREIERAILSSDLGFNPTNDGKLVRLTVPTLTQERREEIVKTAKKSLEECKVEIRNIRRKAIGQLKNQQKSSDITEDDLKDGEEAIQKLTDKKIKEAQETYRQKEKDILEV